MSVKSEAQIEIEACERGERESFDAKMKIAKEKKTHNDEQEVENRELLVEKMRENYELEKKIVCQLILDKVCDVKPELEPNLIFMRENFNQEEPNVLSQGDDNDDL
jgi:hypothetical protein